MSQPATPLLVGTAETIRAAHTGLQLEFRRGRVGRMGDKGPRQIPSSPGSLRHARRFPRLCSSSYLSRLTTSRVSSASQIYDGLVSACKVGFLVGTVRRLRWQLRYRLGMGGTMSALIRENCSESGPISEDRPELGVLFVAGFAEQRPGTAIAAFAGAMYRWLFRWNATSHVEPTSLPTLSDTVLASAAGADDGPAHVTLAVPGYLGTEKPQARWLLTESSWATRSPRPSSWASLAGSGRSPHACWCCSSSSRCTATGIGPSAPRSRGYRRLADLAMALCYLGLMAVAAMASVLLSLVLLVLALVEKLPIPRIDMAVRWVAVKISAVLGDSYMLAHCPVQFAAMRTQVARDLRWLQDHCEKVAVVAHSQGAAIAHQVLKDLGDRTGNVRAFITVGQGIAQTPPATAHGLGPECLPGSVVEPWRPSLPGCFSPGFQLSAFLHATGRAVRSSRPWSAYPPARCCPAPVS